jgi:hypothetical protein
MGRIVSLSLQIRRFRCLQSDCPRRIFAAALRDAVAVLRGCSIQ